MSLIAFDKNNDFISSPFVEQFQTLLESYSSHLLTEGVKTTPHSYSSLEKFKQLDVNSQERITHDFNQYYDACRAHLEMGGQLKDTKNLTRTMISQKNWIISDDFLNNIVDDDVIEIYRTNFTQLYRNVRFLEVCSYPLSELYVSPWPELYKRPQSITDKIVDSISAMIENGESKTFYSDCPSHFLEERSSGKKHFFKIDQKSFAPVYSQGEIIGFIGSIKAELLGSKVIAHQREINVTPLSL